MVVLDVVAAADASAGSSGYPHLYLVAFCIIDDRIYLGNIQGPWLTVYVSKEEGTSVIVSID